MKASAEQCFVTCADARSATLVAWSAGLSESDRDKLREQALVASPWGRVHFRMMPLDGDRISLSRIIVWPSGESKPQTRMAPEERAEEEGLPHALVIPDTTVVRVRTVHTLVFSREAVAPSALGLLPLCFGAQAFLSTCTYKDGTASVRTLEWDEPEEESLLQRLTRAGSRARLSALIEGAVLATPEHPWVFVPRHESQCLPWFGGLLACTPRAWRQSVTWATSGPVPVPCTWRGGQKGETDEAGRVWRFDGETRVARSAFARVLADHILHERFRAAQDLIAAVADPRPADRAAAAKALDAVVSRADQENNEESLFEAARWTRRELGSIMPAASS